MSDVPTTSQRLHDLRGIHSNFKTVLRLLTDGYDFQDPSNPDTQAVLARLGKSVQQLEAEIKRLSAEWAAERAKARP